MLPVIFGLSGADLSDAETRFFREADPLGFILFARNCVDKTQVHRLTDALRAAVGRADAPILIDQEGGRVARLKPPVWPAYPPMRVFGDLARRDLERARQAVRLNCALIGADLHELGISHDCAPLLDVPVEGAHQMIGDRAFGPDPDIVAALGRAACEGFLAAQVMPIVKHLPGYGRARVDSHKALPVIEDDLATLAASDFRPFEALADSAWGMSAHALYSAIDAEQAATVSPRIVGEVVRARIGFHGILVTDDIVMEALQGTPTERALASLRAGCDLVLHCNGVLAHMQAIAGALPPASDTLLARLAAAEDARTRHAPLHADVAWAPKARGEVEALLAA